MYLDYCFDINIKYMHAGMNFCLAAAELTDSKVLRGQTREE